jgi:hypothetical protein
MVSGCILRDTLVNCTRNKLDPNLVVFDDFGVS